MTAETSSSNTECNEEVTKLESKVVLALSRLQKGNRYAAPGKRAAGVAACDVVEYLLGRYCHLDGDVESQVMTALLSCVRTGVVCALSNGKYRLVGPSSKTMVSACLARSSHGPGCSCLTVINNASNNVQKLCCGVRSGNPFRRRKKAPAHGQSKPSGKKRPEKKKQRKCLLKLDPSLEENGRCKYCLEFHPPPVEKKKPSQEGKRTPCRKHYPPGTRYGVPSDKFSPREEK